MRFLVTSVVYLKNNHHLLLHPYVNPPAIACSRNKIGWE